MGLAMAKNIRFSRPILLPQDVGIQENHLLSTHPDLLPKLLKCQSTGKNLLWATDVYRHLGFVYENNQEMKEVLITGKQGNIIKPRVEKSVQAQQERAKDKGEVFTPSWQCNIQNNLVDDAWLGKSGSFNTEKQAGWQTNPEKIIFPSQITWEDYVSATRLEITCGEAPYVTSRYDAVTGEIIAVSDRIGLLDRKLRVISENIMEEEQWVHWGRIALQNIYAYDVQGDNVFLARENVLFTTVEHFAEKFKKQLDLSIVLDFAEIISWNVFQMDGLKFVVPYTCQKSEVEQTSLFETEFDKNVCLGCKNNDHNLHNGCYALLMDWKIGKTLRFYDVVNKGGV